MKITYSTDSYLKSFLLLLFLLFAHLFPHQTMLLLNLNDSQHHPLYKFESVVENKI